MNWKLFAMLESTFGILLSVVAVIFLLFVMTASGGTGVGEVIGIVDIILAFALMLYAYGQMVSTSRRRPAATPRPGKVAVPILTVLVAVGALFLLANAGQASWTDFARAYATYAVAPPAILALVARGLVVISTRSPSSDPL